VFLFSHTRLRVRLASGLPCALSLKKGIAQSKTCGNISRENAGVYPSVIAEEYPYLTDARVKPAHDGN
jgi:hypothetical protein